MSSSVQLMQERWNAAMRDRWKTFSRQWTRLRRHASPGAVHKMRSASRRLVSSIRLAARTAGVPDKRVTRSLEKVSNRLGPLRDNDVYRKTLDRLKASGNVRSFSRFLARQKSAEHRRLEKFFSRRPKRAVRGRIDRLERKFQRTSRDWTAVDYRTAFEKVLNRRYEALISAHQAWTDDQDNKRFHRMRIELRELRYTSETIAEVLGVSRTGNIQTSLQNLRSLQTSMGDIHDLHKLRTELVAWISSRPAKKRASEMAVAQGLQKEFENRLVEFKDHSLASEDLLPSLPVPRRRNIRGTAAANSSN